VEWKDNIPKGLVKVYQNPVFFVQVYENPTRITVSKNKHKMSIRGPIWEDGITWDQLQDIKDSIGYADKWFVELYPPIDEVVNVANMRHLWLIDAPKDYGWDKRRMEQK